MSTIIRLFLLLAMTLTLAVSGVVAAQESPLPPPPFVDVSVESKPFYGSNVWFHVTIRNNLRQGFSAQPVRNVRVQIEPQVDSAQIIIPAGSGHFDDATGILTISRIMPGRSVQAVFTVVDFSRSKLVEFGDITPLRVSATLVPGFPNESSGFELNNTTEQWFTLERGRSPRIATGDAGVKVAVDNRVPQASGQVVFGVAAANSRVLVAGIDESAARSRVNTTQLGVKVKIDISEGLQFAPGLQPPMGTTFDDIDDSAMIWDVGAIGPSTLDVPVVVTPSPSFAELPLERRCLTAKVVEALPTYETDPRWRLNDAVTLCLGDRPAVIDDGEIILWWLHDCVGDTQDPCGAEDDIRLFAKVNEKYLDPESVIIQIPDPDGRVYDGHSASVTSGSVVSWQTYNVGTHKDRRPFAQRNGVAIIETQEDFKHRASDWQDFGPFTLTKGQNLPGHLKIRNSFNGSIYLDPTPSATQISHSNPRWLTPYEEFVEFETLGTHVMTYKAEATRANGVTKYSDEGTYTFHVGPISELEVRDGGQSPTAPRGQQAYTIFAANNGPNAAPDVEVTLRGVPQGSKPALTDGEYRETTCSGGLCDAIWDLGELPLTGGRIASGLTEFPTLTLIAPAGSGAPNISASIANTQDYSVTIDGTTHSTNYFDYYEANDTAVIVARAGTGDPSKPSVRAQPYPQPPTAVLRWDSVERVNLWPVSHYEVGRSDASCGLPSSNDTPVQVAGTFFVDDLGPNGFDEPVCYYVRAVNDLNVPGSWSDPVEVSIDTGNGQGVTVTPTDLTVAEDGGAATYTVVLNTQPPAPVTIMPSTDDPKVATVETARTDNALVFGPGDWSIPQTVTVTGVNDDIDNPQNRRGTVIRHSAAGGGYGRVRVAPVSVTVTDDDETAPDQPPGVTVSQSQLLVAEDGGVATTPHRVAEQRAQRGRGGYRRR